MPQKRTRTVRRQPAVTDKTRTRIQLEYRDISELKNYDLCDLTGPIFRRNSGKRKFTKERSGCFIWRGFCDSEGYGQVSYLGRTVRVARLVFSVCVGDIPYGSVVRHACDNPSCINPEHLLIGSQRENIKDKVERGRQARRERHPMCKLTEEKVAEIKVALSEGTRNQSRLGRKYGVSQSTIWCIANGKSWR